MFRVNWPKFSEEFIAQASQQMTVALNKGQKPNNIVGDIVVDDLNMGTKPPDLEILEIGELADDRFKGVFKMTYAGDAHVILNTKVQANPLNLPRHRLAISSRSPILAANHPLVVPMRLRISNLKLRGIVVLVIDKAKGTTLVFKNDPLEKVDVNSTFDGVASVRRFLQAQIEGQLRQLFREDLPMLIHQLSLVLIQQQGEAVTNSNNNVNNISGSSSSSDIRSDSSESYKLSAEAEMDDAGRERDSPPSKGHQSNHHMTEEMVLKFVNRPHHQKWTSNEPVTTLDHESNVSESEIQSVGAYVLHKSLNPEISVVGLEVITEGIPLVLSASKFGSGVESTKSSVPPWTSSAGTDRNPSPLSRQMESPTSDGNTAVRPVTPLPVSQASAGTHGLRIPVQINHPINRFLSKTPRLEATFLHQQHQQQQLQHEQHYQLPPTQQPQSPLQPLRINPLYASSLVESSYNEARMASSVKSMPIPRTYRHTALPEDRMDPLQHPYYSPSTPPSPRSINIVQRSSISLSGFLHRTDSEIPFPMGNSSSSAHGRYAPAPPLALRQNSTDSTGSHRTSHASFHDPSPVPSASPEPHDHNHQYQHHHLHNPSHQYQHHHHHAIPEDAAASGGGSGAHAGATAAPLVMKDKVVLQPSDNQVTAHLASLMLAHHTISPVMHRLEHATFRTGTSVPLHSGSGGSSVNLAAGLFAVGSGGGVFGGGGGLSSPVFMPPPGVDGLVGSCVGGVLEAGSPRALGVHSLSSASLASLREGASVGSGATGGPSSARKKGHRNVRKLTLPAGMPGMSRSGSGIFGEPGIGQRTAGSATGGRPSSAGSGGGGGTGGSNRSSLAASGRSVGARMMRASARVVEEEGDDLAELLADRMALSRSVRGGAVFESGSEEEDILSPPVLASTEIATVIHRTSASTMGAAPISAGSGLQVPPALENQPPRSTSSLSTRSTSSLSVKAKKVVRVKSNASGISSSSISKNIQ